MPTLLPYKGKFPALHESVFVCDGAVIVGDVEVGELSSIWFNAVVRGDVCPIRIGKRTNVQDNATLHVTHDTGPLTIEDDVTIGHNAVLHACTVRSFVLIGMGAILLDKCVVEPYSLVAAGAVVKSGFVVPSGMLVAGVPAKVIRPLTPEERQTVNTSPQNYINYVRAYRAEEASEPRRC
ncbi:MAG: acetyltransferase [[Candidatus Thermochlorobacteriaceae] bacterium GBChlB]|nr:MAG: acetyltransferase [[Candidatus Thermochlorobacteriaceae] bacterium GBChlB]